MKMHRMLPYASAFLLTAAVGCGQQPATDADPSATDPAVSEPAAAPAVGEPAMGEATQAAEERPRLVPPVRGVAQLSYTSPVVKNAKVDGRDFIVTTFQVKNEEDGTIAGLRVEEFWYDRQGNPVTGDLFRHPRPLQPAEVITVTLQTPRMQNMDRNNFQFSHANGEIKPNLVPSL